MAEPDTDKDRAENSRRIELLKFLNSEEPAWKDEDHAELKDGAAEWVRKLRRGEI